MENRSLSKYQEGKILYIPCEKWEISKTIEIDWQDGLLEGICYFSYPEIEIYFKIYGYESAGNMSRLYIGYDVDSEKCKELLLRLSSNEKYNVLDMNDVEGWTKIEDIVAHTYPMFAFESKSFDKIDKIWSLR